MGPRPASNGDRPQPAPDQLVEVRRGKLKPVGACTPRESRRALRILQRKRDLVDCHTELLVRLLKRLDETGATSEGKSVDFAGEKLPVTLHLVATGEYPSDLTLPAIEADIRELERLLARCRA